MLQPHFEGSVRSPLTFPKMGLGSPPGLPETKSAITGPKHLALRCSLYRWKGLEVYMSKMASHEPFGHLQHKLWSKERSGVQTRTVSGLHFGSPRKKNHLDASVAESYREYYMGEGGGFLQVRAMVNQVSSRLPMACPNTKRVQNEF